MHAHIAIEYPESEYRLVGIIRSLCFIYTCGVRDVLMAAWVR